MTKSGRALLKGLADAKRDRLAERFDVALPKLDRLFQVWPDHPRLLTWRAALLQIQEGREGDPILDEAGQDLEDAVAIDPRSSSALIDLAYFNDAVDNDPAAVARRFAKAVRLRKELLTDALIGQARACSELGQGAEALRALAQAEVLRERNAGRTIS